MNWLVKITRPAIISFAVMTLICGVIYTAFVTGIAQLIFSDKANGSIIAVQSSDGSTKEYGSALIGQEFTKSEYLIGRPMGITNLSSTSKEQEVLIQKRIDWWYDFDPNQKADLPADLITASGSGCDPNISPEAAEYQVIRIARGRNMSQEEVENIIDKCTTRRFLGFWGEPSVNVLKVNLMLDGLQKDNQ